MLAAPKSGRVSRVAPWGTGNANRAGTRRADVCRRIPRNKIALIRNTTNRMINRETANMVIAWKTGRVTVPFATNPITLRFEDEGCIVLVN